MKVQEVKGNWKKGWALDLQTLSSRINPDGSFDTERQVLGDLLYRLKYCDDPSGLKQIVSITVEFLKKRLICPHLAAIIPVPPSDTRRKQQPVRQIALGVGEKLEIPVPLDYVTKTRETPELKAEEDPDRRKNILKGVFRVKDQSMEGKQVLVLDDLYRSGATLTELTSELLTSGRVGEVYVLTITKTRKKK